MEHQSLLMKAMRDFAMSDPENCEREWDAYLALLNRKETVSVSSSTSSTSPVHHRAPARVVTASATTRSTAPLRAPSDAVSTTTSAATASTSTSTRNLKSTTSSVASASSDIITKDDLSPGARRLYDYLVGASTELHPILDAGDIGVADLAVSALTTCSSERPSHDACVYADAPIPSATPNSSMTTGVVVPELTAPEVSDKAFDDDATGDTTPTDVSCLQGVPDHSICGEDLVSMSLTLWSASTCANVFQVNSPSLPRASLDGCSARSIDTPPRLLAEAYMVFNDVPSATAFVPWPPPSCTCAKTPLICGYDLFRHTQQKCAEKFLDVCVLQSPVPPPVQDLKDNQEKWSAVWLVVREDTQPFQRVKVVKLKPPWPLSLGMCMNLPMGKILSSLGSITINDKSSSYMKCCLDDVVWQLPKCLPDTPCVQEPNAVLNAFSWPWITIKYVKVQARFSYSAFPVNCQFATVSILLSGGAQMNEKSNWGTSLNLVLYRIYHALNIAYSNSWRLITVVQYGLEADVVLLLISWLCVPCLQVFLGLPCAMQRYIGYGSSAFLAFLNGRAEVKQHCTCTRVLTDAVCKAWIHLQILQGNPHYSELMQWPSNHSQLRSEFWFYASGHILLFCYALVQWLFSCPLLVKLVEFKPWPSWELFPCNSMVTSCLRVASHILPSSVLILTCTSSRSSPYCEVHILDASFTRLTTKILRAGKFYLLQRLYSSCDQFETESAPYLGSQIFEWQIPWYIGGNEYLIMQFTVKTMELQPTKNICCSLLIQYPGVLISARASFFAAWRNAKQLLGAGVCSQNWQESTNLQSPCCRNGRSTLSLVPVYLHLQLGGAMHSVSFPCHDHCLRHDCGSSFSVPVVLVGERGVHYAEAILLLGVLLLTRQVEFQPSQVGVVNRLHLQRVVPSKLSLIRLVMPWDPGGSTWCRLGVKPTFKEGGLSATTILGCPVGRHSWAIANSRARPGCGGGAYIPGRQLRETRLGTERKGGFGRGLARRVCVCSDACPSSSSSLEPSSFYFHDSLNPRLET